MEEAIALNIAYAVYVASGFAKTFIRLRLAMIAASLAFIAWGLIAGTWSAIVWNVAFGAVHVYNLVKLWMRRRSIDLTTGQAEIHQRLFSDLDLVDFYTLWSIGSSTTVAPGSKLIVDGSVQETVMLIISGKVSVLQDGTEVSRLGPDSVVGERSYLTGERANATVIAVDEVTIHTWDQEKMKALSGLCPPAHESMTRHIGRELASKLR